MSKNTDQKLKRLRKKIDSADQKLLKALSQRFAAVERVGKLKKERKMPIVQKARWKELLVDRVKRAKKLGVSESFIRSVFKLIHLEAIRLQRGRK